MTQIDPATQRYGLGYFETLDMIATMLGAELDSKDAFVESAVLTRDVNLGWVDYAAGTVGGQRRTYRGLRNGRPVIELAICWTMSDDALDPQWTDPKGFSVVIEGEPRVDATIRFGEPGEDVMTVLMASTAVAAVNAIPFLCDAQPGVITPIDLPIIGSPGALRLLAGATSLARRQAPCARLNSRLKYPGSVTPTRLATSATGRSVSASKRGLPPCGVR